MSHYHAHSMEILSLIWERMEVKDGKVVAPIDISVPVREYLEEHFIEKEDEE